MPSKIFIDLEKFKEIYLSNKYENKQIAKMFNISLSLFYIIKRKMKLKKDKYIDIDEYKKLYYNNKSFKEIGIQFNITKNAASKIWKKNNLQKRKRIPHNKGYGDVILTCYKCKKTFISKKHIKKNNKRVFCSKKCAFSCNSGKDNSQYGKHSNKGQTKENSEWRQIAAEKIKGQNNPMFRKGKNSRYASYIGFRKDLNHICRSSWEANFARILKYEKIDYLYEKITFDIYDNKTYTPDFFVPKKNIFYEIKGYGKKDDFKKIKYVFDTYGKTVVLIDPKEYNKLKEQYKNIINWENDVISFKKRIKNINFIEINIEKIIKYTYSPKKVYNLSLEDNDCFFANKICVHNSVAHEIKAVNAKALTIPQKGGELVWRGDKRKTKIGKQITDVIFRKKVWHPGTQPTFFMRNAADKNRDTFIKEFTKNLKK
jgi:hypothetical protein